MCFHINLMASYLMCLQLFKLFEALPTFSHFRFYFIFFHTNLAPQKLTCLKHSIYSAVHEVASFSGLIRPRIHLYLVELVETMLKTPVAVPSLDS